MPNLPRLLLASRIALRIPKRNPQSSLYHGSVMASKRNGGLHSFVIHPFIMRREKSIVKESYKAEHYQGALICCAFQLVMKRIRESEEIVRVS